MIRDSTGGVLLVRKHGTAAFMQPGGKLNKGESDVAALSREIIEELGCCSISTARAPSAVSNAPQPMNPDLRCERQSTSSKSKEQ